MFATDLSGLSAKSLPASQKGKKKEGKMVKVENLRHWSRYEYLVYNLDVLVPEEEPEEIFVPTGSYLQKVSFRDKQKWRVLRDTRMDLPAYLVDHKEPEEFYDVYKEEQSFLPMYETSSQFLKKWDFLGLLLLVFTAVVTPFETAFFTGQIQIDILFLINRVVDSVFMFDMFVQSRTPFRDVQSGKLVRNPSKIFFKYLSGWFFIDLISVIPFELLGLLASDESSVGSLGVLRVLRLMKLAKLLRIFRASRKLKQIQVYINLRYATMQLVKYLVIVTFLMHWLACGFRIAADKSDPNDQAGWVDHFAEVRKINVTSLGMAEVYLMALYMSSGSIALIGYGWSVAQPSSTREFVYSTFVNFVSYFLAVYFIANLSDTLAQATRTKTQQDIIVDNYLAIFDRLKLDMRLKVKVNEYLGSHFAQTLQAKEASMMRDLPVALHGFISMEVFIEFVMSIPFLVPFIEREPVLTQTICRGIEIRTFSANSLLFNEGFEGVYYLEHGIVSLEGKLFVSGDIFGLTILRDNPKKNEARCLTNVDVHILPLKVLTDALEEYPKIKYYIKRWTAWQLVREYILTYKELYYTAARRGALMDPPLASARPNLNEGEYDDIDVAVLEHMQDAGY